MIYDNHIVIVHLLNYTSRLIPKLHGKMKQKLALLWSWIKAQHPVLVVPYHISWQLTTTPWVITVEYIHFYSHHNSRIVLSNQNVCEWIKHRFVVCILFWQIQNRCEEMDVIRPLFCRYIACNLHRIAHDNAGWWR